MRKTFVSVTLALAAIFGVTPALAAANRVVVVKKRPPKVRLEVHTAAPSPNHVWVSGHWSWNGKRYVWISGSWKARPAASAIWIAGRWTPQHGGWVWVAGHWNLR